MRLRHPALDPRVLMASVSEDSDFSVAAVMPSKARDTAMSLVISMIGLTFEPSAKPWATPFAVKSSTGDRRLVGDDA